MYGARRGRLPANLVALFTIMEHRSYNKGGRVADLQMLTPVDSWRLADQHGLGTVQLRKNARGFTLVQSLVISVRESLVSNLAKNARLRP